MGKLVIVKALFAILILAAPGITAATPALSLTPQEAVQKALAHNLGLKSARLAPELTDAPRQLADSQFDLSLLAELSCLGDVDPLFTFSRGFAPDHSAGFGLSVGLKKKFYTGTSLEARLGGSLDLGKPTGPDPGFQVPLSFSIRQALLRGASSTVNTTPISNARIEQKAAREKLHRQAEKLAAEVLTVYWDLHAALSNLNIQKVALKLSRKTLEETVQFITAGKLRGSEKVVAQYSVHTHEQDELLAQQAVNNLRDKLARLMGMVTPRSLKTPALITRAPAPSNLPRTGLDVLQTKALKKRGDYLALKYEKSILKANMKVADNNLLPKLDLVGSVSFNLRNSNSSLTTSGSPTETMGQVGWSAGLLLEVPLGNREAKARLQIARLKVNRAEVEEDQLVQSISEELKVAWRAVHSAKKLVELTLQGVRVARTKYENEMTRYRAGKSTAQLLALMQIDLIKDRLARQKALANYNKALVDLKSASGMMLARNKQ